MPTCPEKSIKSLGAGLAIALSSVALNNVAEASQTPQPNEPPMPDPLIMGEEVYSPGNYRAIAQGSRLILRVVAEEKLPRMLKRIGGCESGQPSSPASKIRYHAQNPTSTASGGFQELDSTWDGYMGYKKARHAPPRIQRRHAKKLYKKYGTQPWLASRSCWAR
jgi:hypothetical protein